MLVDKHSCVQVMGKQSNKKLNITSLEIPVLVSCRESDFLSAVCPPCSFPSWPPPSSACISLSWPIFSSQCILGTAAMTAVCLYPTSCPDRKSVPFLCSSAWRLLLPLSQWVNRQPFGWRLLSLTIDTTRSPATSLYSYEYICFLMQIFFFIF